jgi:hypothetical protein
MVNCAKADDKTFENVSRANGGVVQLEGLPVAVG